MYRDGIDITPEQFYPMLEKADSYPPVPSLSPSQFMDVFKPLIESGAGFVVPPFQGIEQYR